MSTVKSVFEFFLDDYHINNYPSFRQSKVARAILNCKTKALGGHVSKCDNCDHERIHYNSCRDRHCPMCQGLNKIFWIDERASDVLDAPYFHTVFTIPKELHMLIYQNQKVLYDALYKATSKTVFALCKDHKHLGAQPGFFSILHTWSQDLHYHPHIHMVILAGGLTLDNKWKSSEKRFFIPVKILSRIFRSKYLFEIKEAYRKKELTFYGELCRLNDLTFFQSLLNTCYEKDWYIYTKPTFSGPLAVMKYLGRYTHRIAISNERILSISQDEVRIAVKDRQNKDQKKTVTLQGVEFIRRFLMHVLPKRFVKIRHYGILANRNKKSKLKLCRKLTNSTHYQPQYKGMTSFELLCLLTGKDVTLCPNCQTGRQNLFSPLATGLSP